MNKMLVPSSWSGLAHDIPHTEIQWIKKLPKDTYCALWQSWPKNDLPTGYNLYVVSFHLDAVDAEWLNQQAKIIQAPIIVLSDSNLYNYPFADNIHFYTYYYWHCQLDKIQDWFGYQPVTDKIYKFSAVCNRVTQSKLWITTKLLECAGNSSLVILNNWIEEKNVHNWQLTGNTTLDNLTVTFQEKYQGKTIKHDEFDNNTMNVQSITGNPWQPMYTQSAMHFTNESFHYSYLIENEKKYIYPGPFITEKSLKCLIAGTTMIPVGQFDTYKTLENLGLCFDYPFDTSWDQDAGNLSRSEKIVNLIDMLNEQSIDELVSSTQEINLYNQNYITSGQFSHRCQSYNNQVIELIYSKYR